MKIESELANAVKTTLLPAIKELLQILLGQSIAAGLLVTLPLPPLLFVTVILTRWADRVAEHAWEVPPFKPAQFQFQGPDPVKFVAVPYEQRFVVGAALKLPLFADPHLPVIVSILNSASEPLPLGMTRRLFSESKLSKKVSPGVAISPLINP